MSNIGHFSTALPPHHYTADDILASAREWLRDDPTGSGSLLLRFIQSSKITSRSFVIPLQEILQLNGAAHRAELFQEHARALSVQVARHALLANDIDSKRVDAILFTSCSVPSIPSLDTWLCADLDLRSDVLRIPLYQHGCAGGAVALAIAQQLTANGLCSLVVSVELCSLIFQSSDFRAGNLVGSALFGDGAAATIVLPTSTDSQPGMKILKSRMELIPLSQHLMGYEICDSGTHLRLDRELPGVLMQVAKRAIPEFLADSDLRPSDVGWWLIHPGGAKILEALEECFDLKREQTQFSWDVLDSVGNLSSASIFFVADRFLRSSVPRSGERALVVGVGPGLTLQLLLCEVGARNTQPATSV